MCQYIFIAHGEGIMDITKKEGEFEVILSAEEFFDPVTDESDGAEENSEAADGNSAENSEAAAENSEAAAENAEAAAENAEAADENAEVEAEIAEAADENSEAADGNSEAADGNSEAADENSEVTDGIAAEENSESPGISFTESEEASGEEMRGSTGQAESDRTEDALTNTGAVESDAQEQPGKKKSRKGLIAALVFLGILAGGIAAYLGYGYYHYENRFIEGTIINGIDAGEMTPEEVEAILKDKVEDYEIKISFRDGSSQTVKADQIDFLYVSDQTTKKIIEEQEWVRWGAGRLLGETWEYTAGEAFKVDEEKIKNTVLAFPEFREESQTVPTNAYLQLAEDNTIRIVPETQGNLLIADPVTEAVKAAVLREEDSVNIADVAGAYAVPQVYSTDQGLLDQQSMLNSFLGTTVTYNMPDGTQKVLDRGILKDWITIEENGFITLDEERIRENCENYAAQTASETDMLRSTRIFNSTNRGQLELSCDTWGRRLDQEAESAQLLSDLLTGTSETREPIYSMNITVDDTFGGSYIEVDLANQHVYCYMDGSLFFDAPCVSGTNSVPSRRTVTGVFEIYMKERNRILRGANQEYASFVDFWMPFYEGYGLHNAPWRGEFGGDIYEYSGSHGCVNLSYGAAETIWDNYAVGTPVIVF